MKRILTIAVASGVFATGVFAQTPPRKPGPEQMRLGWLAGTWNFQNEARPSPTGPRWVSPEFSGTETCQWFAGAFHMVCQVEATGPMGAVSGQSIFAYDPSEKTYTLYYISSLGEASFLRGTVAGLLWTWNLDRKVEGRLTKTRITVTEQSPTSYALKQEVSFDGGAFAVVLEGKGTKVK